MIGKALELFIACSGLKIRFKGEWSILRRKSTLLSWNGKRREIEFVNKYSGNKPKDFSLRFRQKYSKR